MTKSGCFIGSGIGGLATTTEQHKVLLERGPGRLSPFMIPMLISNMASGLFSMYNNLRGPNFATCSACATANHAIGEAWRTIKMGDAPGHVRRRRGGRHCARRHRRLLRHARHEHAQ